LPDKRTHRGAHPEDGESFKAEAWPVLRQAVADFSWLLSRGYADKSALKLIGDHFQLTLRQRMAVMRASCSDQALVERKKSELSSSQLAGKTLYIDGYNVLTTVEAGLARGVLILARDGCLRDMASMHGSFRKVQETAPAIMLLGKVLANLQIAHSTWYLDSPVSNSGRLKTTILELGEQNGWSWDVQLVQNPDPILAKTDEIIATADSVILDQCRQWYNLAKHTVHHHISDAYIIDISATPAYDTHSA